MCRRERLYDHSCAGIIYEMCVEEPTAIVSPMFSPLSMLNNV